MRQCLIFLMILLSTADSIGQDEPNFILVYIDDLNFSSDAIGGQEVNTPNIQRIVDAGVNFENAHANVPICSPSRASMLTGLYPHTSGYYGFAMGSNGWQLNPVLSSVHDMFEHFKDNGYDVHGTGKLFHGDFSEYESSFTSYNSEGGNGPWAWDGETIQNGQPMLMTHPSMPDNFANHTDGVAPLSDVPTIGAYTGWINRDGTPFNFVSESDRDLLHDELSRDLGIDIITSQSVDDPFFLAIGISRPHCPFYLPEPFFDMHPIDQITLPNILDNDLDDVPVAVMNNRWNSRGNWDGYRELIEASADSADQQWWLKRYVQGYYAGVSYVDDLLGSILDAVENSPHADNTYIIFTSDHGYHLGEKTLIKKTTLYDVVTKVPFVISGPGIAQSASSQVPVSCIDLYPTIIDFAGLPDPDHNLDGFSLKPLLENPSDEVWDGPPVALCGAASDESIEYGEMANPLHQNHTIKSTNMRYSLYATGEEEIYDHEIDPNEYFNLAKDPSYQDELEWHRNQLLSMVGIEEQFILHDTANYLYHGSFEQELNGWSYAPNNISVLPTIISNGEQTDGDKYLQLNSEQGVKLISTNIRLEYGQTYTAYFDARCPESTDVLLTIQRNGLPNFAILHNEPFAVGSSWQTYQSTFEFNDSINIFNNRIRFDLPAQATCDFDHIRVFKSEVVNVKNEFPTIYPVRIFPNPLSQGQLNCAISKDTFGNNLILVKVFNADGRVVHEQSLPAHTIRGSINTKSLSAGVYFVQFTDSFFVSTVKLIIN